MVQNEENSFLCSNGLELRQELKETKKTTIVELNFFVIYLHFCIKCPSVAQNVLLTLWVQLILSPQPF